MSHMPCRKLFLILDIDGVLIESHGYRQACIDTINDFLAQMGQPNLRIDRDVTDAFEAAGINAEWDMVPLALAAFVNWYCGVSCSVPADEFPPRCTDSLITDNAAFKEMLLQQVADYSKHLNSSETAVNAIYHSYLRSGGKGLDKLWSLSFRDRFFVDTLDPWKCPFFAGLMCRILGADVYRRFYGMEAPVDCTSYLETKDILLISDKNRRMLQKMEGKDGIFPVVMTYRPSLYPVENGNNGNKHFVNTPEAECALQMLGWDDGRVQMIGAGSLCFIEEKKSLRREYYVKPHPFHALASVMAALCVNEIQALEMAWKLCEQDPKNEDSPASQWLSPDDDIILAVFEDSVSGIKSVRNAVEILREWGYNASGIYCGIKTTDVKNEMLIAENAVLYADFNTALDAVLAGFEPERSK